MKQLYLYVFTILTLVHPDVLVAKDMMSVRKGERVVVQDSTGTETDSVVMYNADPTKFELGIDSVKIEPIGKLPFISLQQIMKANATGVYAQETTGEPGSIQTALTIRGMHAPYLSEVDLNANKPLIVINGIELVENSTLSYNIRNFKLQPIGNATDVLTSIDLDNVESIHVLKGIDAIARFGPRASNGVIYITTKNAEPGKNQISINGYSGFANTNPGYNINAYYEKEFRKPFYVNYGTEKNLNLYPSYLSDSTDANYYGASNWSDLYYGSTPIYSLNGSLIGGSSRSNFRFFGSHTSNASGSDNTRFTRSNASFFINMLPASWLTISSSIQASRSDRKRNRSLSELINEVQYIPDLSTPLSPTKEMYSQYLLQYDKSINKNVGNSLMGTFFLNISPINKLNYSTGVYIDYNENLREVFYPSTLLSQSNYVSDYFGYNSRVTFSNKLNYQYDINENQRLDFLGGLNLQITGNKYNYQQGYNGLNDFIKENSVEGNTNYSNYLVSNGFVTFNMTDRLKNTLVSYYAQADYDYNKVFKLSGLLRQDGSSNYQADNRFFTSYMGSAEIDLAGIYGKDGSTKKMLLNVSYGRLGIIPETDIYNSARFYNSSFATSNNVMVFGFNGYGTASRPYNTGWIDKIGWAYNDMLNISLNGGVFNNSLDFTLAYYNIDTKNQPIAVPVVAESGYVNKMVSGMEVNNKGVDFTLSYTLPQKSKFGWTASFNIAYNQNELTKLPDNLQSIVVGDRKLSVGNRIDSYWLLYNDGIYLNDFDVPVSEDYKLMSYRGIPMKGGDPRFRDLDGDFNITDEDKVLTGNFYPKYVGGLFNTFRYNKLDVGFQLYFNLKKDALNQGASKFYNFQVKDEGLTFDALKDITYWERNIDESLYPVYNVWSTSNPYQLNQNMFLEDASFLKLRSVSLGYDFTSVINHNRQKFKKVYGYITANNLLTITNYSGKDPELINFFGIDTGLSIKMPQQYTLGFKLDF